MSNTGIIVWIAIVSVLNWMCGAAMVYYSMVSPAMEVLESIKLAMEKAGECDE